MWRYPVKSFQGERVEQIHIGPGGSVGDRALGGGRPRGRKRCCRRSGTRTCSWLAARYDGDEIVITLPTGESYEASDPAVHAALSAWLDMDVRLEAPPAEGVFPMEMYTGMSDEDTPTFDWGGPPGTWLDLADAHFLTTASLRAFEAIYPEGDWDVRRFRPDAVFASDEEGFVEEGWATIAVGSAEASVLMPTMRCSMPSRGQPGLERDKAIGTTIRDRTTTTSASTARSRPLTADDAIDAQVGRLTRRQTRMPTSFGEPHGGRSAALRPRYGSARSAVDVASMRLPDRTDVRPATSAR